RAAVGASPTSSPAKSPSATCSRSCSRSCSRTTVQKKARAPPDGRTAPGEALASPQEATPLTETWVERRKRQQGPPPSVYRHHRITVKRANQQLSAYLGGQIPSNVVDHPSQVFPQVSGRQLPLLGNLRKRRVLPVVFLDQPLCRQVQILIPAPQALNKLSLVLEIIVAQQDEGACHGGVARPCAFGGVGGDEGIGRWCGNLGDAPLYVLDELRKLPDEPFIGHVAHLTVSSIPRVVAGKFWREGVGRKLFAGGGGMGVGGTAVVP